MHKTKLITKAYPHDRKIPRQPSPTREDEQSDNVSSLQLELFPVYSPTYTPVEESYNLEEFIRNLQSEQMMYQDYFEQYDTANTNNTNRRAINQINNQYLQKMGTLENRQEVLQPKIHFEEEMTVKYYCGNDAPQNIAKYQEYVYPIDKQQSQFGEGSDII